MLTEKKTYNFRTFQTDTIPVYNIEGQKVHEIHLPEKITPMVSKRGGFSDTNTYYKGAGITYQSHIVNQCKPGMKVLEKTNIVYEKYAVCYPKLVGRFGIFLFPHQAVFSDMEGGCGKKEMRLMENQKSFELSAIKEITDVIPTGIENHNIYAYRLKEKGAQSFDIVALIEYVLQADFNTAWDKNLWSDIYCYSYVRDVADWFVSKQLSHKVGTVYALLSSLYKSDVYLYSMLLKEVLNTYNCDKVLILYFSALIVYKYCPEQFDALTVDIKEITLEVYRELLRLLFSGKACCHLENDEEWNWVREFYFGRIENYCKVFQRKQLQAQFI